VINNNIIERVYSTNYLGYTITVSNNRDSETKMNRFNQMCSSAIRTLNNKASKERQMKEYSVTCSHSCTLKMEAIRSSETSVLIRATRRHLPEDDNYQK
jgi:nitrogen-specific signal transduction histidine kinase